MKLLRILPLPLCLALGVSHAEETEEAKKEELRPGHSHAGEAFNEGPRQFATLIEGTGEVDFPITSSWSEAAAFFNQGVGQLHGFWYFEAERSFRHIAAHDPDCAMAFWGMAMANWENEKRAKAFIKKAVELKDKVSEREQLWIDAQNTWLNGGEKDKKKRYRKLLQDTENIIHKYPDDIEAKAFHIVRIWQASRGGVEISSYAGVDALLQQIFDKSPNHPAHHYRIHVWDNRKAEHALNSSAILGQSAPAIAHMWHMPGHIYSKVKRYDDGAWQQEASARVDHQRMFEQRILPDRIHNYAHNNEWLIRNMSHQGRAREAMEFAKGMLANPRHPKLNHLGKSNSSTGYGRRRLFEVLVRFEMWDDLIALSDTIWIDPTEKHTEQVKRLKNLGVAWFGKGDAEKLKGVIAQLTERQEAAQKEQDKAKEEAKTKAEKEKKDEKAVKKAVADAGKAAGEKIKRYKPAVAELNVYLAILEDRLDEAKEKFKDIKREKAALARLRLRLGQEEEALKLSEEAVTSGKNRTLPLAARAEILHTVGKTDEAKKAFEELKKLSARIDLSATPFQRLADLAKDLGEPEDWRIEPKIRNDIGERPDLATLGPLQWTAPMAIPFTLPDGAHQPVSLSDYRGKPVILIFYLGHGCLHCVEQLNAFAPKLSEFQKSGIEILAVSTDTISELKLSQEKYTAEGAASFPFKLAADPDLAIFKSYRAHDDFEKKALHGTFLIGPQGRVLWQDIGPEPFNNPDFLLKEAPRLVEIHSSPAA